MSEIIISSRSEIQGEMISKEILSIWVILNKQPLSKQSCFEGLKSREDVYENNTKYIKMGV